MRKSRQSISKAKSYQEIGQFWDTHDLSEYWNRTRAVKFKVEIKSERIYYPVDSILSEKLRSLAHKRGISPETLLNLWIQQNVSNR